METRIDLIMVIPQAERTTIGKKIIFPPAVSTCELIFRKSFPSGSSSMRGSIHGESRLNDRTWESLLDPFPYFRRRHRLWKDARTEEAGRPISWRRNLPASP